MDKSSGLKEFLTIREVCRLLNVHPNTLRNWDRAGKLKAVRIGPRRDRRYRKDDVLSFFYGKKSKKRERSSETPALDSGYLDSVGTALPNVELEDDE